ncbi:hypothetical protein ACOMHN_061123 [Nucella lapillus]
MSRFQNVYPMATNINFYKQCVPAGSCDIIFSSIATHWLEQLAVTFKDSVFGLSVSQQERSLFDQEVDRDWTKFLLLRARELKPQGLLVVLTTCSRCPRDTVPGEITPIAASGTAEPETKSIDILLDTDEAWRQLKNNSTITQEEYKQCTAKMCFRNSEENQRPFVRADSAVQQSGLRLVHYDEVMAPCVYKAFWRQHYHNIADEKKKRALFADQQVQATRVWTHTTFHSSLSDMRTEPEKAAILDDLYSRFHSLVMGKDPESYRSESSVSRLIARKTEGRDNSLQALGHSQVQKAAESEYSAVRKSHPPRTGAVPSGDDVYAQVLKKPKIQAQTSLALTARTSTLLTGSNRQA